LLKETTGTFDGARTSNKYSGFCVLFKYKYKHKIYQITIDIVLQTQIKMYGNMFELKTKLLMQNEIDRI